MTPRPASETLTAMTVRPGSVPAILRTLTLGSADWETRGVLRPQTQPQRTPARFPPADDLSAFVDLYWIARWDLAPGETTVVETLPHPCVNVVVEPGRSRVHGPVKGRFSRTLAGRGRVVSARLRPGAFRVLSGRPAWRLVDVSIDFPAAFGVASGPLESAMLGHADDQAADQADEQADEQAMIGHLEQFLRERLPAPDPTVLDCIDLVDRIVGRIAADRDIARVEDLAQAVSLGRRTLERLFREYVGPSPKWVIRQYRLQAAADEAAKGRVANWSRLASDLGYADQAHFIRDFRAILGATPTEFARQAARPRPAQGRPAA
ncbi:MAG TPA: helix-turn-helix domain-containing protein [Thermoanaerobaculia bacterium]|nr:helix-turn-helix domain-containing protein [Thermoanaerobaculia bacterium]